MDKKKDEDVQIVKTPFGELKLTGVFTGVKKEGK